MCTFIEKRGGHICLIKEPDQISTPGEKAPIRDIAKESFYLWISKHGISIRTGYHHTDLWVGKLYLYFLCDFCFLWTYLFKWFSHDFSIECHSSILFKQHQKINANSLFYVSWQPSIFGSIRLTELNFPALRCTFNEDYFVGQISYHGIPSNWYYSWNYMGKCWVHKYSELLVNAV